MCTLILYTSHDAHRHNALFSVDIGIGFGVAGIVSLKAKHNLVKKKNGIFFSQWVERVATSYPIFSPAETLNVVTNSNVNDKSLEWKRLLCPPDYKSHLVVCINFSFLPVK